MHVHVFYVYMYMHGWSWMNTGRHLYQLCMANFCPIFTCARYHYLSHIVDQG